MKILFLLMIFALSSIAQEEIPIIQPSNHFEKDLKSGLNVCNEIIPHQGMINPGNRCCWNKLLNTKSCVIRDAIYDIKLLSYLGNEYDKLRDSINTKWRNELLFEIDSLKLVKEKESWEDSIIVAQEKKERLKRLKRSGWSKKIIAQILSEKISIGMTKSQVIESWGEPQDINRTVIRNFVHEQWVYEDIDTYVYFENGVMTSFQD